ncbi:hypothetical protein ACM66B_003647 [Microbotryomycetes sp. NB124-2]
MFRAQKQRLLQGLGLRLKSSCTVVKASSSADRQLALPLAFVGLQGTDDVSHWRKWAQLAAEHGFESVVIALDHSPSSKQLNSTALVALESELVNSLRESANSPFPPVLLASGLSTLVAETYVSSHPLSGLFLHEPIVTDDLPPGVSAFDYEPHFPIGLLGDKLDTLKQTRLGSEWYEDEDDGFVSLVQGQRDESGWRKFLDWLDRSGL